MKKHISEIELCECKSIHTSDSCIYWHKDEFCLLCGYEMEGDRLYLEIHGSNGALNRIKDIDSAQPYVCMECVGEFEVTLDNISSKGYSVKRLIDFIKERKK